MIDRKFVEDNINDIKSKMAEEFADGNFESSLTTISLAANILYQTNIYYMDDDLEHYLQRIAQKVISVPNDYEGLDDGLLYWDGFGLNERGLTRIYLQALCKHKNVIYVTYEDRSRQIPDVRNILESNGCKCCFIRRGRRVKEIKQLATLVEEFKPKHFFFYSVPDDVTATSIMYAYQGKLIRYQINLTDHAFWLGAGCLDKCIEFRSYGASISAEYRKIPKEKIVCLPYYPIHDPNKEFEGYPLPFDPARQKMIFSGGALYKTMGEGDTFYKIVEYILSTYPETVFWYAGTGDSSKMKEIIKKYPGRAVLTEERKDLFQVLEHCRFYLNTYPMWGGLMTQYAAMAGKVPVSLGNANYGSGVLIHQDELEMQFDDVESLKAEIDRLMADDAYLNIKGERMKKSVISVEQFESSLTAIVDMGERGIRMEFRHENTANFQQMYLSRITKWELYGYFVRKDMYIFLAFPAKFALGSVHKIGRKIRCVLQKLNLSA